MGGSSATWKLVPPGEPTLDEVRAVTARFQNVEVAVAEGYIRDPFDLCDNAELMGMPAELGAMGIHYFRPALLGVTAPPNPRVSGTGTNTDFTMPSVLIYEPQQDGSLALVAVENLAFEAAWRLPRCGGDDRSHPRRRNGTACGISRGAQRRIASVTIPRTAELRHWRSSRSLL